MRLNTAAQLFSPTRLGASGAGMGIPAGLRGPRGRKERAMGPRGRGWLIEMVAEGVPQGLGYNSFQVLPLGAGLHCTSCVARAVTQYLRVSLGGMPRAACVVD